MDDVRTDRAGQDPTIFGHDIDGRVGYPLAFGIGSALFSHVAVAEETVFRGYIQSTLARSFGETAGWLVGSVIFGATHALNALLLPPEQRAKYLYIGVPVITLTGTWLGYAYKSSGYSLAPSVAVHFWYDLLLSATFFVLDPKGSPLAARVTIPF
jgi:membrane protease YdiL (CAAX protease family)